MRFPKGWSKAICTVSLSGLLLTGVAFASGGASVEQSPAQPSPGVQELLGQIRQLRQTRVEQFKAEVEALINKAQAEGKITPDEANRLKQPHGAHGHKDQKRMEWMRNATEAQVKAKLKEAVKSGRMTQEQADLALKRWREWKAKAPAAPKR